MKKTLALIALLFAASFVSAQSFDLPCASGTTPLLAPTYNPSTGNYRAWVCVDAFGTVSSPVFATASGVVTSFNTRTGAVVPASGDYTVGQVTGAAPLTSPALTGTPTAPTATAGTNSTQLATTAYHDSGNFPVTSTLTVSSATVGNGILALSGNTSGTATITAPATAGTRTNPMGFSNDIQVLDNGSASSPALGWVGGNGFFRRISNSVSVALGGSEIAEWTVLGDQQTTQCYGFVASFGGTEDAGLCRRSAALVSISSSGVLGNGSIDAASFQSRGTKFTASGCSNTTTVGGATAGKFSSGTTGTCTVTITMGNTATSPNGWSCDVHDQTTPADVINLTGSTQTTATVSGTTVSGDVIAFSCMGY